MPTYGEWVESVKVAYQGGAPSRAQLLMAVKDGVAAVMQRDIESDLALSKSYQDRFDRAKIRLAGERIDADALSTLVTDVRALLAIAADTDAASGAMDNAIEAVRDEVNRIADKFDRFVLEAAIELQRHVPFYRVRQIETYLVDTDGVISDGFISRIALPEDVRLQQVWYGPHYPDLTEGEAVDVDDIVLSNGRLYKCVVGGTLSEYELGDGLTSTDGEEEEIGSLTFTFYNGDRDFPARPVSWSARQALRAGQECHGPGYTMPEEQDLLWLYPALDDTHRFDIDFVGIAQSFEDADDVTFDKVAAKAAAFYLRGMFEQTESNDPRASQISLAHYQRAIREAVLDCQDRQAGPNAMTAPYDWRRNPRCYSSSTSASTAATSAVYPNGWINRTNSAGDITLRSTHANMTVNLTVAGVARTSTAILDTDERNSGDRMIVLMSLPAVAGIGWQFRDESATGTLLLPDNVFPDQQFTTDGETTSAFFEFVYNGANWEYVGWRSPA